MFGLPTCLWMCATVKIKCNRSGRLGALFLASWNDPLSHIDVIAVRMIEGANTAEFLLGSTNSDHELN